MTFLPVPTEPVGKNFIPMVTSFAALPILLQLYTTKPDVRTNISVSSRWAQTAQAARCVSQVHVPMAYAKIDAKISENPATMTLLVSIQFAAASRILMVTLFVANQMQLRNQTPDHGRLILSARSNRKERVAHSTVCVIVDIASLEFARMVPKVSETHATITTTLTV